MNLKQFLVVWFLRFFLLCFANESQKQPDYSKFTVDFVFLQYTGINWDENERNKIKSVITSIINDVKKVSPESQFGFGSFSRLPIQTNFKIRLSDGKVSLLDAFVSFKTKTSSSVIGKEETSLSDSSRSIGNSDNSDQWNLGTVQSSSDGKQVYKIVFIFAPAGSLIIQKSLALSSENVPLEQPNKLPSPSPSAAAATEKTDDANKANSNFSLVMLVGLGRGIEAVRRWNFNLKVLNAEINSNDDEAISTDLETGTSKQFYKTVKMAVDSLLFELGAPIKDQTDEGGQSQTNAEVNMQSEAQSNSAMTPSSPSSATNAAESPFSIPEGANRKRTKHSSQPSNSENDAEDKVKRDVSKDADRKAFNSASAAVEYKNKRDFSKDPNRRGANAEDINNAEFPVHSHETQRDLKDETQKHQPSVGMSIGFSAVLLAVGVGLGGYFKYKNSSEPTMDSFDFSYMDDNEDPNAYLNKDTIADAELDAFS